MVTYGFCAVYRGDGCVQAKRGRRHHRFSPGATTCIAHGEAYSLSPFRSRFAMSEHGVRADGPDDKAQPEEDFFNLLNRLAITVAGNR